MTPSTPAPTQTPPPARRAPGDGSLTLKGAVYMARLYLPSLRKYKKRSTGTADPRKAERFLAKWKAEIQGGTWAPDVDKTSFEALATMLADDYHANHWRSWDRVEDAVAHLRATFGLYRARAITTDRVLAYRVLRQGEGAANATVNRELAALKRMFRLGQIAGKVLHAPHIPMLEERNTRTGFFEEPDFRRWLVHLPADLQPLAEVAYLTGWRVHDELLTRQWLHVDFEHGWLRLEPGETKNGEGRMFPLTADLRAVLERQRERTRAVERETGQIVPWLFHRQGKPVKSFRRAWRTACRLAGLPGKIPHDFRRTAVRNLERAGVPRSAAMKMVGHRTEAIYRRYAIAEEGVLREAGAKLDRFRATAEDRPLTAPVVPIRREERRGNS
jgi:integrase